MTAFSDETGRDALAALAEQCREILEWHKTGNLADGEVRRLASTMQESIPEHTRLHIAENKIATEAMKYVRQTALSASPVAQEPVAFIDPTDLEHFRREIYADAEVTSQPHVSGDGRDFVPLYTSPPATPVAQEPVATKKVYIKPLRTIVEIQTAYADQIRDWLNTSTPAPPATSAGVGADEIARALANSLGMDLDEEERMAARGHAPSQNYLNEWNGYANAILALLSRAGDQK